MAWGALRGGEKEKRRTSVSPEVLGESGVGEKGKNFRMSQGEKKGGGGSLVAL